MSNHYSSASKSAHARPRHHGRSVKWLAAALVTVAVAGGVAATLAVRGGATDRASARCGATRVLHVSAAPEIAPTITAIARRAVGTGCQQVRVDVAAVDPAAVATALGRQVAPTTPDFVWIPDSALWAQRVSSAAATVTVLRSSIARTPIVLAASAATAHTLGGSPTFAAVAARAMTTKPILLGARDLNHSAPALSVVSALVTSMGGDAARLGDLAALLRTVASTPVSRPGRLPATPATVAGAPVAVATSEQAVWTADHVAGAATYSAVYAPDPGLSLDYPFLVVGHSASTKADAATLLGDIDRSSGRAAIAAVGFRSPDGAAGPTVTDQPGLDPAAPSVGGAPTPAQATTAVAALAAVNKPSRMLALMDVSGSMSAAVPGAHGATRIDIARAAAAEGLTLLGDTSIVGLWRFSADLTKTTDYQELVPLAPLNLANRATLAAAVTGLRPVPNGGTGLYDSILAAVQRARAGYDATRVNSVVVLTDGKDESDPAHGIKLSTLLSALRAEHTSTRPVMVITIGYGPDSDATALHSISGASGGIAYLSKNARDLPKIFREAVGQRLCPSIC
jgi:Ca-activated chloride channel family protein